jgi:C4-dicarboxylate transporter DctM subunit
VPRPYAAGIVPGLLLALVIAAYVVWRAKREGFGRGQQFDARTVIPAMSTRRLSNE